MSKVMQTLLFAGITLVATSICVADDFLWQNSSGDGNWATQSNWQVNSSPSTSLPTSSDGVLINGDFSDGNWPNIIDRTTAQAYHIFMGYGESVAIPELTIDYRSKLNISTNGLHVGFVGDAIVNNYGSVDTNFSHLQIGEGNEWGYGRGTVNVYAGRIKTSAISFGTYNYSTSAYEGGTGEINIYNGEVITNSIQNLETVQSYINIEKGVLAIDGDVRDEVTQWIADGKIIAYSGSGKVISHYNEAYPNMTCIRAINTSQICKKKSWWDVLPRIVAKGNDLSATEYYNANIAFNHIGTDPTWGIYTQKRFHDPYKQSISQSFTNAGLKNMAYYETFGETVTFVAEIGGDNRFFWNWQLYNGVGEQVWVGPQDYFDNMSFAMPYTRDSLTYGSDAMKYPDGTIATGYNGSSSDPRNHRVFDAGCSKSLLGKIKMNYSYNDSAQSTANGQIWIPQTSKYSGHVSLGKDTACPAWNDYAYASAFCSAENGADSCWTDNYSAWDNFGKPAVANSFGEWSVATFRDYLSKNFSTAQLSSMGVSNVSTFDIREKLKSIATVYGWNGSELAEVWNNTIWDDSFWANEAIWHAYKIHKRQQGTQALTRYQRDVHSGAANGGAQDYLIAGNDIPGYSLGYARGNLDMVSTEIGAEWNLAGGTRGYMLPPIGRYAPVYKTAREHANSRFVNVWFYTDGFEEYDSNPGLCNVLYAEMLANHTMPMLLLDGGNDVFGDDGDGETKAINPAFFAFVESIQDDLGLREPFEEIGVYYSTSSVLATIPPAGLDVGNQPHQFAFWGWETALGEIHYLYKTIPEWKLDAATLNELKVLIIPDSKVFDPADVSILTDWVNAGGKLIVTGESGLRLGESGNFAVNSAGLSLSPLTTVSSYSSAPSQLTRTVGAGRVMYLKNGVGRDFYDNEGLREYYLAAKFTPRMSDLLNGEEPTIITDSGFTSKVAITAYQDICKGKFFIDFANFDIELETDTITNTPQMSFFVNIPDWLQGKNLEVNLIARDISATAQLQIISPSKVKITIDPIKTYASVIISFAGSANINNDSIVNLKDYAVIADKWLNDLCYAPNNWCDGADIDLNNSVDMNDSIELITNWLE